MVVGILLGNFVPQTGPALQKGQFVGVSVPIAIGLLIMMYPILCKVRFESLYELLSHKGMWKQIIFSIFMNWVIAPFLMVLVWTGLAGGDGEYCAILVAINSILQMVLFAPLAVFFIRVIGHEDQALHISYTVVATSVGVFLGIPLAAAVLTRSIFRAMAGPEWAIKSYTRSFQLSEWQLHWWFTS
ncbi:putative arsenical-resistance protein [Phaeoacremonium minimum UCRPA7]|uniref:Putative arsenical-resistance protein n=1 Tax=Phaeoacremonium minimum (strain UCR-PA7) TaxID=1286976 RepID=R8BCP3_PHAM7|nr:putative arsenical-resistance protein [Phaeoacremonium minimum UCRPA7]EON97073.1 putative arsenical-resistance protein [Phaeoacremonium minimum UCRPA7]